MATLAWTGAGTVTGTPTEQAVSAIEAAGPAEAIALCAGETRPQVIAALLNRYWVEEFAGALLAIVGAGMRTRPGQGSISNLLTLLEAQPELRIIDLDLANTALRAGADLNPAETVGLVLRDSSLETKWEAQSSVDISTVLNHLLRTPADTRLAGAEHYRQQGLRTAMTALCLRGDVDLLPWAEARAAVKGDIGPAELICFRSVIAAWLADALAGLDSPDAAWTLLDAMSGETTMAEAVQTAKDIIGG